MGHALPTQWGIQPGGRAFGPNCHGGNSSPRDQSNRPNWTHGTAELRGRRLGSAFPAPDLGAPRPPPSAGDTTSAERPLLELELIAPPTTRTQASARQQFAIDSLA